jgi:prolyl-tRNA editing enzyme YbaK/EbsC (Cys-tRNA(Pro) deacylase)
LFRSGRKQVCFEGGDHRSLVQVSGEDFARLKDVARTGSFSMHA